MTALRPESDRRCSPTSNGGLPSPDLTVGKKKFVRKNGWIAADWKMFNVVGIASTMQGNRENSNNTWGSPFDSGFGFPGSIFGGGRDPFDDPFFARPYGSLFGSNLFSSSSRGNLQQTGQSKGPVIEELDSDDEGEPVENDATNAAWRNRNPLVEHPEDQANGK
ncbi:hypothetical protein DH2020_002438 [Rehmannia glutinosa]|uniref:Uncharacterized protein n=1 Tax=Rehmannia glutinosa TaxID=99300 RepID=A0ABR0XTQ4_REHGL